MQPLSIGRIGILLQEQHNLTVNDEPTHDQLQALVAGLAGVGYLRAGPDGVHIAGIPPKKVDGVLREGYIVNPKIR